MGTNFLFGSCFGIRCINLLQVLDAINEGL